MKKYNKAWIKKHNPCKSAVNWAEPMINKPLSYVIKKAIDEKHFNWAEWAICRELSHKDNVRWAIYSTKQVLPIFEEKYPDDKRPRKAIAAAEKWAKSPSKKNKDAAYAAAHAAYAAAHAAYAADAAHAAYAAADAAHAAHAATDAAYAAHAATDAAHAAYAAYAAMRRRCDLYGLRLMKATKKGVRK